MSFTNEQDPNEINKIVPHSGNLGLEKPVETFDNTPLEDAVEQNLITTPDHPGALVESNRNGEATKGKWFVIGTAATALVAAISFAVGSNKSSNSSVPEKVATESNNTELVVPTTLQNKDVRIQFENVLNSYLNFENFENKPVMSDDPEEYIIDLNRLVATYVMDSDKIKSQEALKLLTGASDTPTKFREALTTIRNYNFSYRIPKEGIRETFVTDPSDIELVRYGANYAMVKATNVSIIVREDKNQNPQENPNSPKTTSYYYIRIMPDGQKNLFAVDSVDYGWQGGETFD